VIDKTELGLIGSTKTDHNDVVTTELTGRIRSYRSSTAMVMQRKGRNGVRRKEVIEKRRNKKKQTKKPFN